MTRPAALRRERIDQPLFYIGLSTLGLSYTTALLDLAGMLMVRRLGTARQPVAGRSTPALVSGQRSAARPAAK